MEEDTQLAFGEHIRLLRRQRSMTQSELGGEQFSKSYVSAVERGAVVPSYAALRFFAQQLDQPFEELESLLQHALREKTAHKGVPTAEAMQPMSSDEHEGLVQLLDQALEDLSESGSHHRQDIAQFAPEKLQALPAQVQARYYFVRAQVAQEQQDSTTALYALEHALVFSSEKLQPTILDALGTHYFLQEEYQMALNYHQRALRLLQNVDGEASSSLLLKVELHCGDDYRALGSHHAALQHYERVRHFLRTNHHIQLAAQLYLGLGYCLYGTLYQPESNPGTTSLVTYETRQWTFEQVVSFLIQSRTLFQVGADRAGESHARLLQAQVLLDCCQQRRYKALESAGGNGKPVSIHCTPLLEEAEEQCRQVLALWQDDLQETHVPATDAVVFAYTALACLIRITTLRASITRLAGYGDIAARERGTASYLCQQVLDTLSAPTFSWRGLQSAIDASRNVGVLRFPTVPTIPDFVSLAKSSAWQPLLLLELCLAVTEIANELSYTMEIVTHEQHNFAVADACMGTALWLARQAFPDKEHDISYLTRCYQYCIALLESRMHTVAGSVEETTKTLLSLLKEALLTVQSVPFPTVENAFA